MTAPARQRMSGREFRETWERAQMDLKLLMERTIETQHQLHELIGIQAAIYQGVIGEDAPDFEFSPRMVRGA